MFELKRDPSRPSRLGKIALCALALPLLGSCQDDAREAEGDAVTSSNETLGIGSSHLRQFIAGQVGGLDKLKVPGDDASIPLPPEDPARPGRYRTTEAKRFLGKMLFHDPVRTVRVNINENVNPPIRAGAPRDLPKGTAFGGTVSASNPIVQAVVAATRATGSCGSCHLGEAAGKAGAVLNFNTGGEGRGYTDEQGR